MKLAKNTYKAVYVEWIDSTMQKKCWWSFEDIAETMKTVSDKFQTVAYLILENKLEYIFCASIHFEDGEAVSGAEIFSIPKGCVIKMKVVTI